MSLHILRYHELSQNMEIYMEYGEYGEYGVSGRAYSCYNYYTVFPCVRIPILNIRRSWKLLLLMGIPILVRRHHFIEAGNWHLWSIHVGRVLLNAVELDHNAFRFRIQSKKFRWAEKKLLFFKLNYLFLLALFHVSNSARFLPRNLVFSFSTDIFMTLSNCHFSQQVHLSAYHHPVTRGYRAF